MNETEKQIENLIALGYRREDIKVLSDGLVVIEPHDEASNTAVAVSAATRAQRLVRCQQQLLGLQQQLLNAQGRSDYIGSQAISQRIAELEVKIESILAE